MQLFLAAGDVFDDIEDLDNPKSIVAKYGLGLATNVATTLLILAEIELTHITSDENNHNIVPELINDVNEYFKNACIGQHLDISSNLLDNISENYYLDIVNMKSASQFECACKLGAMIATNNQELINLLCQYGRNIGNAMQLGNDIEGVVSKKDILQRKVSLPVIYALSHAAVEERETIRGNFKKVQPAFNPNEIQDLLFRTGAVHYTILKMEHFKQQAKEAVIAANTHGISSERLLWFLD